MRLWPELHLVTVLLSTTAVRNHQGAKAFDMFQAEMRQLLDEMKARGEPPADDQDIAAQLYRVMNDNPNICENRILSEIGMLFVEGFETTGALLVSSLWCMTPTSEGFALFLCIATLCCFRVLLKPGIGQAGAPNRWVARALLEYMRGKVPVRDGQLGHMQRSATPWDKNNQRS